MNRKNNRFIFTKLCTLVAKNCALLIAIFCALLVTAYNRISKDNEKQHRTMLGMITLFLWFGRGENLKDHSKLLLNIWPAVKTLNQERFWSSETVQRATLSHIFLPFPSYKDIRKILDYKLTPKTKVISRFAKEAGQEYKIFIQKAIHNKDFLFYGQRAFIESYFAEEHYRLEDTSIPFDWDHILPHNLIYRKRGTPSILKEWYVTNGNFRAWPYALNRMDSDNNPSNKLNPLKRGNLDLRLVKEKWELFISKNNHLISDLNHLNRKLLEWSFCKKEWEQCNPTDIRQDWSKATKLIINRNIYLIEEWYKQLNIEILQPEKFSKNSDVVQDLINSKKWTREIKRFPDFYNMFQEGDTIWLSDPLHINGAVVRLYFYYSNDELDYLFEGGIRFGVYEPQGEYLIKQIKDQSPEFIDLESYTWVENHFTLISTSIASKRELVNDIHDWIERLSVGNEEKDILHGAFPVIFKEQYLIR